MIAEVRNAVRAIWAQAETIENPRLLCPDVPVPPEQIPAMMASIERDLGGGEGDLEARYALAMLARNSGAGYDVVVGHADHALALSRPNTQGEREILRFLTLYAMTTRGPSAAAPYAKRLLKQEDGNPALYHVLASAAWVAGDVSGALNWIAVGQRDGLHAPHFQPATPLEVPPARHQIRAAAIAAERRRALDTPTPSAPPLENGKAYAYDALAWSLERTHAQALGGSGLTDGPSAHVPDAVSLTAPFGKDRNHMSGVGIADLVLIWYPSMHGGPDTSPGDERTRDRSARGLAGLDVSQHRRRSPGLRTVSLSMPSLDKRWSRNAGPDCAMDVDAVTDRGLGPRDRRLALGAHSHSERSRCLGVFGQ